MIDLDGRVRCSITLSVALPARNSTRLLRVGEPPHTPVRVIARFSRVDVIARVVCDRGTGRYAHAVILELIREVDTAN
jgi:hypothetical protein